MSRPAQLAISLLISAALASPVLAQGQAVGRGTAGTSSGSGSSGSGSSGSSGSSGGSSGTESRTSSGSSERVTMPPLPDRPTANSDQNSGQRTRPSGSSSSGSATTRSSGGGKVSGGGSSTPSSSGGAATRSGSGGNTGSNAGLGNSVGGQRNRGNRPVVGVAVDRSTIDRPSLPIVIAPWTNWYPWYSGLGWNFGYVTYGPYGYGRSRWLYGPYGWYDPWDYDPYYSPYYRERYEEDYRESESRRVGSIRLRANPEFAQVFVDGALVGVVDDFNGLTNHLELEGGTHKIELRAEGYETYAGEISVKVGKTVTERINLKKK